MDSLIDRLEFALTEARIPKTQYHATSWDRVPHILKHGMKLPRKGSSDARTFAHTIPSISTADRIEDARPYAPRGAVLELRVRPGFKYMASNLRGRRGESMLDLINRLVAQAKKKGLAGVYVTAWQSTIGSQTIDPRALEVVRVVNADESPAPLAP